MRGKFPNSKLLEILIAALGAASTAEALIAQCALLNLEYTGAVPASAGRLGTLAVDQDSVWISQDTTALRYRFSDGIWSNDGFVADISVSNPEWMSPSGDRVIFGRSVFQETAGSFELTSLLGVGNYCEGPIPALASHALVYGYSCINYMYKGAAEPGNGNPLAAPNGPPNQPSPGYLIRSGQGSVLISTIGGDRVRINRYRFGGNALAASLESVQALPEGPIGLRGTSDLVATQDGAALTASFMIDGNYVPCLAQVDTAGWSIHYGPPLISQYISYSVACVGDVLFLQAGSSLYEVTRGASGDFEFEFRQEIPGCRSIRGGTSVLAATIADSTAPSGTRIAIYRVRSQMDCDGDGIDDCEATTNGLAPDRNQNQIPDACECLADLFADGQVDGADLGILLNQWGLGKSAVADINRDGSVDGADLSILLNSWGGCP